MANLSSLESKEENRPRCSALNKHKIQSGEAEASGPVCPALRLLPTEPDGWLHEQTGTIALYGLERPHSALYFSLRMVSSERFITRDGEESRKLWLTKGKETEGRGRARCVSPRHPSPCTAHSVSWLPPLGPSMMLLTYKGGSHRSERVANVSRPHS